MDQEGSPTSQTNRNPQQHKVGYSSHFSKQQSDRSFRSLNNSGSGGSGPGLLAGNRANMPTSNIVNRALEVMSNSLKDADYIPRQPVKSLDDGDTEDESERTPSENSDNDNDASKEPNRRLGNITAQLSFRKIAKKRRKAGGRSSFHHTKSSKEYLRKAQEAYQRLKISEQQQQNDQNSQPELESGKNGVQNNKNSPDCSSQTSNKTKEQEEVDYGYGDPADSQPTDTTDYGYGDTSDSQPQQAVDYGYGDPADNEPQPSRTGGRARRRNSVTKYSLEAANVVAAQAAAARIMRLKPGLTSASRSTSKTPTRRRPQQDQPRRFVSKQNDDLSSGTRQNGSLTAAATGRSERTERLTGAQTTAPRRDQQREGTNENQKNKNNTVDKMVVDRLEPPQRSSSIKQSSRLEELGEPKQSNRDTSSRRSISSKTNQHLRLTSDYFSSDPKPKNLVRRNSGRLNGTTFRFSTPARTYSGLSYDNSYSAMSNDDDDIDSLASDMESLCSMRDDSYRLDISTHSVKNTDMPPVLPRAPPASPLTLASPPPDRRSRFTAGRSRSGDRQPLLVSWSSGSSKGGALSRFANRTRRDSIDKARTRRDSIDKARARRNSNDFPILPSMRVLTANGSPSKSCMPAPVRRTPSYKGTQQRQD